MRYINLLLTLTQGRIMEDVYSEVEIVCMLFFHPAGADMHSKNCMLYLLDSNFIS